MVRRCGCSGRRSARDSRSGWRTRPRGTTASDITDGVTEPFAGAGRDAESARCRPSPVVCRRSATLRLRLRYAAARAQPVVRKGTEPCSPACAGDSPGRYAPRQARVTSSHGERGGHDPAKGPRPNQPARSRASVIATISTISLEDCQPLPSSGSARPRPWRGVGSGARV